MLAVAASLVTASLSCRVHRLLLGFSSWLADARVDPRPRTRSVSPIAVAVASGLWNLPSAVDGLRKDILCEDATSVAPDADPWNSASSAAVE